MTMCVFEREGETFIFKDELEPRACITSLTASNSRLICEQPKMIEEPFFVCSSNVLPEMLLVPSEPDGTLAACRAAFRVPRECGGPREVGGPEVRVAQFLVVGFSTPVYQIPEEALPDFQLHMAGRVLPAIQNHPLWRSGLGFITADVVGTCVVAIAHIIGDIMRFAKGDGRMKFRLRNFFRLSRMTTIKKLLNPDGFPISTGLRRLQMLQELWTSPTHWVHLFAQAGCSELAGREDSFLIRYHDELSKKYIFDGMDMDEAHVIASYKTAQRTLDFVRLLWLHGIGEQEFDPHRFFQNEDDARDFVRYATQNS